MSYHVQHNAVLKWSVVIVYTQSEQKCKLLPKCEYEMYTPYLTIPIVANVRNVLYCLCALLRCSSKLYFSPHLISVNYIAHWV